MTRGKDLQEIGRKGKRIRTGHLEVRATASPLSHVRLGFIVPKYGHSSVERNRLKRRLREASRLHMLPVVPVLDVVVRARSDAYRANPAQLVSEVTSAANELRRLFG